MTEKNNFNELPARSIPVTNAEKSVGERFLSLNALKTTASTYPFRLFYYHCAEFDDQNIYTRSHTLHLCVSTVLLHTIFLQYFFLRFITAWANNATSRGEYSVHFPIIYIYLTENQTANYRLYIGSFAWVRKREIFPILHTNSI